MFRFAIPAVAALGLIAAAAQGASHSDDREAGGMGWHLSQEGSTAKLAYGLANSDQLALMMTCEPGGAQAVVYGDVQPASPRLRRVSTGAFEIDPLDGGLFQEASIPVSDPTLRRLARDGSLAVEGEAGRFELTASRKERRLIGEFFDWCGKEQA